MADTELKRMVDDVCDTLERLTAGTGLPEGLGAIAKQEMGMFMMYLAASDGEISQEEADLISETCDLDLTVESVAEYIDDNDLYSEAFEQKEPVSLKVMVAADNVLYQSGQSISGSEALLETYRALGIGLITADDVVTGNEEQDLNIYINMMTEYRNKNYKGAKNV